MVIVANCHAHGALRFPVLAERGARLKAHIHERAVTVVPIQVVRARIVGDEEIGASVAVEVAPDDTHTEAPVRIGDASLRRDVLERAIALVAIQRIA